MNRSRHAAVVAALAGLSIALSSAQAQNLRISQVYGGGGGTGAAFRQDYVELFNPTASPVDLSGLSIQYASATGTTWTTRALIGSVPANGYFLIQMSSSTLGNGDIPPADQTVTTVSMSATAAKVALVIGTTPLTGACPTGASIVDFVGYGTTANCNEGGSNAPAPSIANAIFRSLGGCTDTNANASDFSAAPASPRTSQSPVNVCVTDLADLAVTVTPTATGCGVTDASTGYNIVVTNNGPLATSASVALALSSTLSGLNASFAAGATPSVGTVSGSGTSLTWDVGTLANGASASVPVTVNIAGPGVFTVTATTTSSVTDPTAGNSTASATNFKPRSTGNYRVLASSLPTAPAALRQLTDVDGAIVEFEGTTGGSPFGRLFMSPDGTRFVFRADTNAATTEDTPVVVGTLSGNTVTFQSVAQEGKVLGQIAELAGLIDLHQGINDSGQVVFSTNTDGATATDEMVVRVTPGTGGNPPLFEAIVREGLQMPGMPEGVFGGSTNAATSIANDGSVMYSSNVTGAGITTGTNDLVTGIAGGATASVIQRGDAGPNAGSGFLGGPWNVFDTNTSFTGSYLSADGNGRMISGTLNTGSTTTDDTVSVNGEIVLQENAAVPGNPTPGEVADDGGTVFNYLDAQGNWYAYGDFQAATTNGPDFAVRNGVIIARTGEPAYAGATEVWSDTAVNPVFSATFFLLAGRGSDYVVGGVTNAADTWSNGIVVHNGTTVVAREGDPVDIDGDGLVNDGVYINIFRNDMAAITADRKLLLPATLRGDAVCGGTAAQIGHALLLIPLPGGGPGGCNVADIVAIGGQPPADGLLTGDDFNAFIGAFAANDSLADIVSIGGQPPADGLVTGDDFNAFIAAFAAGCP